MPGRVQRSPVALPLRLRRRALGSRIAPEGTPVALLPGVLEGAGTRAAFHQTFATMDAKIATQPNEKRCDRVWESHTLELPSCCPVSKNPLPGSEVEINYFCQERHLEVFSLKAYLDSYVGGRGEVRSMEGMIAQVAQDCADALGQFVWLEARLNINPGQRMTLRCAADPKNGS
jgi:NADPH-dependent 7-cyano-7-deazaguanine reductase QueF